MCLQSGLGERKHFLVVSQYEYCMLLSKPEICTDRNSLTRGWEEPPPESLRMVFCGSEGCSYWVERARAEEEES